MFSLKKIIDESLAIYLLIGVSNTIIGFGIIFILMYFGFIPEISNFIGYSIGFIASFYLNKKINFKSKGSVIKEFGKFGTAMLIAYLVNLVILLSLFRLFNINKYIAQVIAGGFYVGCGYILSKSWVFSDSKIMYKKGTILTIFFLSLIAIYGLILIIEPNFGVIDDHTLLHTLLIGKKIPLFVIPEIGRFFPLNGFEYNIISYFSVSPFWFYFYNFIQFYIFILILYTILKNIVSEEKEHFKHKFAICIIIIILIISPGFVTAWYRLFVPERSETFFLVIFLYCYLKFQKKYKSFYFIVGLISANIALYLKEPAFLMIGSFALFHLIFAWKELNVKQKLFDMSLLLSSFLFILAYFLTVYINIGDKLYGQVNINFVLVLFRNIFNMALHDPFAILLLLPLTVLRLINIIKTKKAYHLYDSLLFSSLLYLFAYINLNIPFSYHYLLPIYVFGLISFYYYFVTFQIYKKIEFKILISIFIAVFLLNALPTGIHLISFYKNVPYNFQKTLSFLTDYISQHSKNGKRISLFLYGVNRNGGEVHHSFIKYLEFKGLTYKQFDIKSEENDNGILPIYVIPESPYTVLREAHASEIKPGDLIIITPYTAKYIDLHKKQIEILQKDYDLLYQTNSLDIPNLSLKTLIKYFTYQKLKDTNSHLIIDKNIFKFSNFYVFKKK